VLEVGEKGFNGAVMDSGGPSQAASNRETGSRSFQAEGEKYLIKHNDLVLTNRSSITQHKRRAGVPPFKRLTSR
jgi:hypothetical protein